MYQSLYYDFNEYIYYLRDDIDGWSSFKYSPTYYIKHYEGEYITLEGDKVTPIKKIDYKNPNYFEKDVDKITRLLVDYYYQEDDPPSFHNLVYLDIECEIGGALTPENIKAASTKITSIALYSKGKYYCFVLDSEQKLSSINQDNKIIISCKNEKTLLLYFLEKWKELDPTIISSWNGCYFDIPYLYYRIKNVLGDSYAVELSPIRKVRIGQYELEMPIKLGGINHLDYMLLFKKYIVKQESSYKLGDIGNKYVNLGKINYKGSLDSLYKEDINKFIEYNLRDVEIIVALEEKLKFIDLTLTICHLCHVEYEKFSQSTTLNEGAILTYLKRKGIVSPNKPITYNPSLLTIKEEYAGGYLKEPIPGLYEWVIDLDFTSLYPSIIRSLNLGIETLMFRIINKDKYDNNWSLKELKNLDPEQELDIEKVKKDRTLTHTKIKVKELLDYIINNDLIISAPGIIFRKDKTSIVCEILSDWFDKRQEYKKLMKEAYKKGDKIKGDLYNQRQHAYKIKLNDVYGVFAINSWRYTDGNKFISKAITLTGQRLVQESIKYINNYINNELNNKIDYIITSDTDSLFINIKDLLFKRFPEININNREEVTPKILEIASELQKNINLYLNSLVKELFNINNHFFELKQEVIIERGYFAGKRRYAQFIINKEGIPVEELDMKGLDLMKSNFPPLFKNFGESIIKDIIFGKKKLEIDSFILNFKESLKDIDWKKLLKPTGLKKLEEYISKLPSNGEIFSHLALKCPINTRSAIYYNDILKYKKLDNDFPLFQVGDKMYITYLKNNPYGIECIGYNGFNDPPEIIELIETYVDRNKIFDSIIKNKIEKLYNDLGWGFPILNRNVNKFFKW